MNRFDSQSHPRADAPYARPLMVSILSGKGGVGKSVVAFNLAERAAAQGYLTLLVDADLACGNLHILANVDPADGLDKFIAEQHTLDRLVVPVGENLRLLARSTSGPIESLNAVSSIARCAARLRRQASTYDLVIVDHSSGINTMAAVFAGASDVSLLVMVPEVTSISDCYGLYKFLCQTDRSMDCRVLLNRVGSSSEADDVVARFSAIVEQFLSETPRWAGSLQEDEVFRLAVAGQRSISAVSPESPVLQVLDDIIGGLVLRSAATTKVNQPQAINVMTAPADIRE